jgi:hypothetical protein
LSKVETDFAVDFRELKLASWLLCEELAVVGSCEEGSHTQSWTSVFLEAYLGMVNREKATSKCNKIDGTKNNDCEERHERCQPLDWWLNQAHWYEIYSPSILVRPLDKIESSNARENKKRTKKRLSALQTRSLGEAKSDL